MQGQKAIYTYFTSKQIRPFDFAEQSVSQSVAPAETAQQTQNLCVTFVQRQPNVFDAGPALYKCYANVLCLLEEHVFIVLTVNNELIYRGFAVAGVLRPWILTRSIGLAVAFDAHHLTLLQSFDCRPVPPLPAKNVHPRSTDCWANICNTRLTLSHCD